MIGIIMESNETNKRDVELLCYFYFFIFFFFFDVLRRFVR